MPNSDPPRERIGRLLRFIDDFRKYEEGRVPFGDLTGGQESRTEGMLFPRADYPEVLDEFVDGLREGGWLENEYSLEEGRRYIDDRELLKSADLATCKRLLTFCTRRERFHAGFWKEAVESGFASDILRRVQAIWCGKPEEGGG